MTVTTMRATMMNATIMIATMTIARIATRTDRGATSVTIVPVNDTMTQINLPDQRSPKITTIHAV
jgi:hypothetical protein